MTRAPRYERLVTTASPLTLLVCSQVCALQWNRHERELLSSHGFSKNQLCLWKYPSLVKVAEMTGHQGR